MFQGIDPEGLDSLADTLETQTVSLRHQTRIALDALYRNQRGGDAAAIGALLSRVEEWGIESSAALRWRTAMIQSGQDARLDIFRLARCLEEAVVAEGITQLPPGHRSFSQPLRETPVGA